MFHDVAAFFEDAWNLRPHHKPGFQQKRFTQKHVKENQDLFSQQREKIQEYVHEHFVLQLHQPLIFEGVIFLETVQFAAVLKKELGSGTVSALMAIPAVIQAAIVDLVPAMDGVTLIADEIKNSPEAFYMAVAISGKDLFDAVVK